MMLDGGHVEGETYQGRREDRGEASPLKFRDVEVTDVEGSVARLRNAGRVAA